jgi:23S rRNA A1618 N6-methylase RlmF
MFNRQITKSLLKRDFGLELKLPDDRLCPPVPNRWAYVSWIQGLIDSTKPSSTTDRYDPKRQVTGLDIGVGSSCIYPLLACAARPSWKFSGTEVDQKSYEYAVHNVASNELESRIQLSKTNALHRLIPLDALKHDTIDFTMCNPPFFKSIKEMEASYEKGAKPGAVCVGSEVEMVTDGGEAAYVSRMVDESYELCDRVQWYTSLLGKLDTLPIIVEKLKGKGCANWAVGLMLPHAITRRWVIGWSWGDWRPMNVSCAFSLPRLYKQSNLYWNSTLHDLQKVDRQKNICPSQQTCTSTHQRKSNQPFPQTSTLTFQPYHFAGHGMPRLKLEPVLLPRTSGHVKHAKSDSEKKRKQAQPPVHCRNPCPWKTRQTQQ